MAIDLARLSLWLATFAKTTNSPSLTTPCGTAIPLVGLTREQIEGFHWKADVPKFQMGVETIETREHVTRVSELRQLIREVGDSASRAGTARAIGTMQTARTARASGSSVTLCTGSLLSKRTEPNAARASRRKRVCGV